MQLNGSSLLTTIMKTHPLPRWLPVQGVLRILACGQTAGGVLVSGVSHAPSDVAAPADLLANCRFVYASAEDVLVPGSHHWFWFKHETNTWEPFEYTFDTKILSSDEAANLAKAT